MTDPIWADGYVVDIDYTDGYYRELAPELLRFVALLGGMQRPEVQEGFNYCELGCGNGRSLVLHAAADPRGRFFGVDFNPTHILNARNLARDAGTGNAVFFENSFAELHEVDLPEMDFITLHGVHSWVSAENRQHITAFIRRRLKPGGLIFISYNCLPGLAALQPLQRLLMSQAARGSGPLGGRIRAALDFANRLDQAGASYFRLNPVVKSRLDSLGKQSTGYLAHEYFNANWQPSYHADVCAEMADAKAAYIGSAALVENFVQFALRPEHLKLLEGIEDRVEVETLRDYIRHTSFRRDVFARGAPKAGADTLEAMLKRQRFCLAKPRSICHLTNKLPAGDITLQGKLHVPVLDALANGAMTFEELAAAPETRGLTHVQLRQAVFALAAVGNVMPALPAEGEAERREACRRFNATVLARPSSRSGHGNTLASPVMGSGVQMGYVDLLMLGAPSNEREATARALEGIAASGFKPVSNGLAIEDPEQIRTLVENKAKSFFSELMPFLRLHGIAD